MNTINILDNDTSIAIMNEINGKKFITLILIIPLTSYIMDFARYIIGQYPGVVVDGAPLFVGVVIYGSTIYSAYLCVTWANSEKHPTLGNFVVVGLLSLGYMLAMGCLVEDLYSYLGIE